MRTKSCVCRHYHGRLRSVVDVRRRCTAHGKISRTLYTISENPNKGLAVARCVKCRAVWCEESVFDDDDDMKCLYMVDTEDPRKWLGTAVPMAQVVVQEDEDRRFFDSLPDEIGPRACLYEGCKQLRIVDGMFCRRHQFEVVHDRPCPW